MGTEFEDLVKIPSWMKQPAAEMHGSGNKSLKKSPLSPVQYLPLIVSSAGR